MDVAYEMVDDIQYKLLQDFLYNNNEDMTKHIPWKVIKFPKLKKIWNDFVKVQYDDVRDEKGLDDIADIMVYNTLKLYVLTRLAGHTSHNPDGDFNEHFDPYIDAYIKSNRGNYINPNQYQMNFDRKTGKALKVSLPKKIKRIDNKYFDTYIINNNLEDLPNDELHKQLSEALADRFAYYYGVDPESGADYMSDYGLEPLLNHMSKLISTADSSEKLYTIDKMLNVVHQRSDLAAWFVEGGSRALSALSGFGETEDD